MSDLISDAVETARRENVRRVIGADFAGNQAAFAEKIGRAPSQVNNFAGPNPTKNIGKKMARHIEDSLGKPRMWLDKDRSTGLASEVYSSVPTQSQIDSVFEQLTPSEAVDVIRDLMDDLEPDHRIQVAKLALAGLPDGLQPSDT